jgi:hypothetical protein
VSERGEGGRPSLTDAFRDRARPGGRPSRKEVAATQPKRRRRRNKVGKRSNPDYTQVSALVMKDVRARFAVAQAQASVEIGRKLEFGELVNLLMAHFAVEQVTLEELEESLGELLEER